MKKVVYSYISNDESRLIVEALQKECDWEPIIFHGGALRGLQEYFPNALFADASRLRRGYFDYSKIGEPIAIDAAILEKLSKFESTYLNWLEDTTGWNFSFQERRRYYYDILTYWNT